MVKRSFWLVFILMCVVILYSLLIEPNWLSVSHHEIHGNVRSDIKIAHLTDLHFHKFGTLETQALQILHAENPDIILITGDTFDGVGSIEPAQHFFRELKPPLGIWSVLGNWENWKKANSENFFKAFGIKLLVNKVASVREDFDVIGFDDSFSGKPVRSLSSADSKRKFCIAMFHSPGFFDEISGICPLALAGHTHGGQIRLPILGPIWLPPGSGNYVAGWYEIGGSKMYVSRGLGTSILPARFLSRPEIAIIMLRHEQ